MMSFKKTVASNKACTCVMMSMLGAAMGCIAAKLIIRQCCCAERLAYRAQKAIKNLGA
ncbi:MAG: hypothetical protein IKK70_03150 [Clostridia bacterium]|nr:hypothetical protein [Clostridia bacterium]